MRPALPCVALVAALLSFSACSSDECLDADEDGYGVGAACKAADCDDTDARHQNDCHSCSDPDDDGYGVGCNLGPDCAASNALHWADCGACVDTDRDGRGEACDLGADCDDNDPDQWGVCGACTDADGDAHFSGCDAYVNRPGPDCDDADPNNYLRCAICADGDGDGRLANCDNYAADMGPDCDDADPNNWSSCGLCRDADADGYAAGCDAYNAPLQGPDCNDGNALHWSDCSTCTDTDADGRGTGCDLGSDCNVNDRDVWTSCSTCADGDGDSRWAGCDSYFTHLGPDCDDDDAAAWSRCATCMDSDSDGYWRDCDTYTQAKPGIDCNDADPNNFASCGTCRDNDLDTYYAGCDFYTTIAGPDCGDFDRNNYQSCSTCQDTDGDGRYADCDSYMTIQGPDCAPADGLHWSDCGACVDTDGDGRGPSCDLGPDCNVDDDLHWSDCSTCTDTDGDGWGVGVCDVGEDCDETDPNRNPGQPDTTVNGSDENCNGIDGPGFVDNFDDGVYAPQWTSFVGDTTIQSTYRRSGSYALQLGGADGETQSTFFDTSSCTSVAWRYYNKRGYEPPDPGENLYLSYWNGSSWVIADTHTGNSGEDATFTARQGVLTATDARHPLFRIRFHTLFGSGTCCDDYYIDDVAVGCNVDTDGDETIDPFDCAPNDPDHWSDCGVCVDGDGDDYGPSCDLGPDCNNIDPAINPEATDTQGNGIDENCDGVDGTIVSATFSATPAAAITDGGGAAVACGATNATSSAIVVATTGTNFDVDVNLNITHPFTSDLDVFLQYDDGTNPPTCVHLATDAGFGANYTNTVFSDEAALLITSGNSPFTGTFRPEGSLTALDTLSTAGTYTLFVNDDAFGNSGTLASWGLTIRYY